MRGRQAKKEFQAASKGINELVNLEESELEIAGKIVKIQDEI